MIRVLALATWAGLVPIQEAKKTKTVWHESFKEAQAAAQRAFKPILVHGFLRTDDGSSRRMWTEVILREDVEVNASSGECFPLRRPEMDVRGHYSCGENARGFDGGSV